MEADNLIILLLPILGDEIDGVLQGQEEEDSLFSGHSLHVHVVDLEDLVARLESLRGCRRSGLHRSHENTDIVATSQPDPN